MIATDADLQALVSQLEEQLRDMTRERDAWRRWADKMPTRSISNVVTLILGQPAWVVYRDAVQLNEWAQSHPVSAPAGDETQ